MPRSTKETSKNVKIDVVFFKTSLSVLLKNNSHLNLLSVLCVKRHEKVWCEPCRVEKTQVDPQWSGEEEHSHRSDPLPGRGQISW